MSPFCRPKPTPLAPAEPNEEPKEHWWVKDSRPAFWTDEHGMGCPTCAGIAPITRRFAVPTPHVSTWVHALMTTFERAGTPDTANAWLDSKCTGCGFTWGEPCRTDPTTLLREDAE